MTKRKDEDPGSDIVEYGCLNHAEHSEVVTWSARRDDPDGHRCPKCGR